MNCYAIFILVSATMIVVKTGSFSQFKPKLPRFELDIEYMEQCKNETNLAVHASEMEVTPTEDGKFLFSGLINFTRPVGVPWKLQFTMMKCANMHNRQTCESFFSYVVDEVCDDLPLDNMIWSSFIKEMKMKRTCPVGPKAYYIEDYNLLDTMETFFPTGNSYYILNTQGFSNTEKIICINSALSITYK